MILCLLWNGWPSKEIHEAQFNAYNQHNNTHSITLPHSASMSATALAISSLFSNRDTLRGFVGWPEQGEVS